MNKLSKLKVGDRVKIIGDSTDHFQDIGSVQEIVSVIKDRVRKHGFYYRITPNKDASISHHRFANREDLKKVSVKKVAPKQNADTPYIAYIKSSDVCLTIRITNTTSKEKKVRLLGAEKGYQPQKGVEISVGESSYQQVMNSLLVHPIEFVGFKMFTGAYENQSNPLRKLLRVKLIRKAYSTLHKKLFNSKYNYKKQLYGSIDFSVSDIFGCDTTARIYPSDYESKDRQIDSQYDLLFKEPIVIDSKFSIILTLQPKTDLAFLLLANKTEEYKGALKYSYPNFRENFKPM